MTAPGLTDLARRLTRIESRMSAVEALLYALERSRRRRRGPQSSEISMAEMDAMVITEGDLEAVGLRMAPPGE